MTDATEHEPERTPRRSAWRQAAWMLGGFAVLMLVLFLAFRWSLHRSVDAELDAIRDAGYPATAAELDEWYEDVPDDENAALALIDAFGWMRIPNRATPPDNLPLFNSETELPPPADPLPEEQLAAIENLLADNAKALERLHEGAAMERARYPVDLSQGMEALLPHLSDLRQGANLLALEAVQHAAHGRAEQAARSVRSMLSVAASLEQEPILISQLVRNALQVVAVRTLERVVHQVELNDAELAELMDELAGAEHPSATGQGTVGERVMISDLFTEPIEELSGGFGGIDPSQSLKLYAHRFSGTMQLDHLTYLGLSGEHVAAAKLPTHQRIAAFDAVERKIRDVPPYALFTRTMMPSLSRAAMIDVRTIAQLRVARAALAVERYRLAHSELPDEPVALTPNFIDHLPPDPFTGVPLKYKKSEKGYTIYSVGFDKIDDNGTPPADDLFESGTDVPFTITR